MLGFRSDRFPVNKFNSDKVGLNSGTTGFGNVVKLFISDKILSLFTSHTDSILTPSILENSLKII